MKRDDHVRQVQPAPIEGKVAGFSVDQESGEKLVRVNCTDGNERYFKESDLLVVPQEKKG